MTFLLSSTFAIKPLRQLPSCLSAPATHMPLASARKCVSPSVTLCLDAAAPPGHPACVRLRMTAPIPSGQGRLLIRVWTVSSSLGSACLTFHHPGKREWGGSQMGSARIFAHGAEAWAYDLHTPTTICKHIADLVGPRTGHNVQGGPCGMPWRHCCAKAPVSGLRDIAMAVGAPSSLQHALLFLPLVARCLQGHLAPLPSSRCTRPTSIGRLLRENQKLKEICK